MVRLVTVLFAALVAVAGCADSGGVDVRTAPTDPSTEGVRDGTADDDGLGLTTCTNDDLGYRIAYPSAWEQNTGDVLPECAAFHPEPFEVEPGQEFFGAAVFVRVEGAPYDEITDLEANRTVDIVSSASTRLDGQLAQVAELRSVGDALLPEGTLHYRYAVDMGKDRTLVLFTYDVGDLDYERNKEVVDQMASTLAVIG